MDFGFGILDSRAGSRTGWVDVDMLSALVEVLLQFLLEIVFSSVGEILSEVGFDLFEKARESRTVGPVFRGSTYLVIGCLLGVLSYFVIPVHVLQSSLLRAGGMVLSVISLGLLLCLVSWFVTRKDLGESFWSTEKFIQGVVFGASYSLTRAMVVG